MTEYEEDRVKKDMLEYLARISLSLDKISYLGDQLYDLNKTMQEIESHLRSIRLRK